MGVFLTLCSGRLLLVALITCCTCPSLVVADSSALLRSELSHNTPQICVNYDTPEDADIPPISSPDHGLAEQVLLLEPASVVPLCRQSKAVLERTNGTLAVAALSLNLSECLLSSQLLLADQHNVTGLLVLVDLIDPRKELWLSFEPPFVNRSGLSRPLPIYYVTQKNYNKLLASVSEEERVNPVPLVVWIPELSSIDWAIVVIALIALVALCVGSYLSGIERHKAFMDLVSLKNFDELRASGSGKAGGTGHVDGTANGSTLPPHTQTSSHYSQSRSSSIASYISIFILIGWVIGMLMLMYFYYGVVVWIVIVMFIMYSASGIYGIVVKFCDRVPHQKCVLQYNLRWLSPLVACGKSSQCLEEKRETDVSHILLYLLCCVPGIVWCIFRRAWWAFILQDILAVFLCINVLKVVRLPNLKWITIFFTLCLIYDVVFVFISPLWTQSGCSIMVDAATGGACTSAKQFKAATDHGRYSYNETSWPSPLSLDDQPESLPILLYVPKINEPFPCLGPYDAVHSAMLGLGDIILPGFLISYGHAFDLAWQVPGRLYFVVTFLSYVVGLVITEVVLMWSRMAQPALLYLVPFTLVGFHALALARSQWRFAWHGLFPLPVRTDQDTSTNALSLISSDELALITRKAAEEAKGDQRRPSLVDEPPPSSGEE